jgi:hypothetical protein
LVVGVLGDTTTDDVTGVTYAGNAMTFGTKLASGGTGNRWAYLYYQLNPASGANNVVVSASSSHYLGAGAADYTGIKLSAQPDATMTPHAGSGPLTTLTSSITTVANNSWAILLENGFSGGNAPPTAGTGVTRRAFDAAFGGWALFDSNGLITPAGSYSMTTNRSPGSDTIDHIALSFSPG